MNNAVVLSPGKTGIFSLLAKACVLRSFRTVWQECLHGGSLEPAAWVQVPDLPFISCVALIKLIVPYVLPFPHLQNEDNDS